jgi:hypothetical protein
MAFNPVGVVNWLEKADAAKAKEDELIRSREDTLLALALKKGGTGSTSTTEKNETAAAAALKLQERFTNANITDENTINFFNRVFEDPYASQEVLTFLEDQAKDQQRDIRLEDLPDILGIVDAPTTVDDKIDLLKEFEIVDLSNKEEYYKLAQKVNNMTKKSGRTVFIDVPSSSLIDPEQQIKRFNEQFELLGSVLTLDAQQFVINNPDPSNDKTNQTMTAIKNLEDGTDVQKTIAMQYLYKTYAEGPEWLKEKMERFSALKGIDKDPRMQSILALSEPAEPSTQTNITRVVTQDMVNKNPDLQPYVGQEVEFELRDGKYYPVLGS